MSQTNSTERKDVETISKPGAAIEVRVVPLSESVKAAISLGLQKGAAAASSGIKK